ncbi:hypothetical protein IFM89_014479, partial [Coptis chinensis]
VVTASEGVQKGSNDTSSECDPFLAPTYESEDSVDDVEVDEQGCFTVPSDVRLSPLDENMPLTTTPPASPGGLNLEYWEVNNLLAMGRAFGRHADVDDTTAKSFNGVLCKLVSWWILICPN